MSFYNKFANPTGLHIGACGILMGKNYHVLGRMVMTAMDHGNTYLWNEYNLEDEAGDTATLVYEEGQFGGEWRLVTMFDPEFPMTADAALILQPGDRLNLDGLDMVVSVKARSRVSFTEGKVAEWIKVGAMADYVNAKADDKIAVVSWTGQEVEFYHGLTLHTGVVETAFKIRRKLENFTPFSPVEPAQGISIFLWLVLAGGIFFLIFAFFTSYGTRSVSSFHMVGAPLSPLMVPADGMIGGVHYKISRDKIVELDSVGLRFQRHEYPLEDDLGKAALLVFKIAPNAKEWAIFTPVDPVSPMTPQQAAAAKMGDTVNIDGLVAKVDQLFISRPAPLGVRPVSANDKTDRTFGFSANSGKVHILVRWNETFIVFYKGDFLADKEVRENFH